MITTSIGREAVVENRAANPSRYRFRITGAEGKWWLRDYDTWHGTPKASVFVGGFPTLARAIDEVHWLLGQVEQLRFRQPSASI
jgi:hypothetical protein